MSSFSTKFSSLGLTFRTRRGTEPLSLSRFIHLPLLAALSSSRSLSPTTHVSLVMRSALVRPAPTTAVAAGRQPPRAAAALPSEASKTVRCRHHRPRLVASPPSSLLPSSQRRTSKTVSVRSAPTDEQAEATAKSSSSSDDKDDESGANKPTTTTTTTPPSTPQPPPQLPSRNSTSLLRRLATSLAAAFVRAVLSLGTLLGGRELRRRVAALAAGALFVAVAVIPFRRLSYFGEGAAARAPHAISASISSSASAPPASASFRGKARKNAASSSPSAAAASTSSSSYLSPAAAVAAVRSVPAGEVPYSQFLRLVSSGNVRAARLEPGRVVFDVVVASQRPSVSSSSSAASSSSSSRRLFGLLRGRQQQQQASSSQRQVFALSSRKPQTLAAARLPGDATTLVPLLQANGVEFAAASEDSGSVAARVLAQCLMLWLPLAPLLFLMSRAIGGRGGGAGAGGFGSRGRGRGGLRGGKGGVGGLGAGAQR